MSAVARFPPRRSAAVWLLSLGQWGWLVLVGEHAWLHGDYDAAVEDAAWISANTGFPIRETAGGVAS
jgi:hypothetical protein